MDQSGRFGQGHELCRGNRAIERMPPAQKRLGAGRVAACQTVFRLKMQAELVIGKRC
jgi:hypothetical protein